MSVLPKVKTEPASLQVERVTPIELRDSFMDELVIR